MRFFKYLVLIFLSILSVNAFAISYYYNSNGPRFSTVQAACDHWFDYDSGFNRTSYTMTVSGSYCYVRTNGGYNYEPRLISSESSCPSAGTEDVKSVPFSLRNSQVCIESCLWNPIPTGGMVCGENTGICATDFSSAGTSCSQNTDLTPSQDDINNTSPEPEPMVCTTDYCVKPADKTCPVGYSKQMFNNVDYCVKDGKNPPDNPDPENPDPDNPNSCTQSYCPKPDDTKDCPAGYYPTVYNGEKICVKDNPTPNQPNPNDPNNNDNPPSSEPVAGDDPNTSFDTKGIIDSIKALRDSLLGAIDSVSKKISSLVDGQKTSNEHLKNIEQGVSASSEVLSDMKNYFTDETGSDISAVDLPTEGISVGQIDTNIFKVSEQCPVSQNLLVTLSSTSKSFGIEYDQLCDILRYMGYLISLVALLHAGQILVRDS